MKKRIISIISVFSILLSMPLYSSAKAVKTVSRFKCVSVTTSTVKLRWKKVKGATGYQIYDSNKKKIIKTVKSRTVTIKKLKPNKKYKFKIRFYKKNKNKTTYSKYTKNISVKTKKQQIPTTTTAPTTTATTTPTATTKNRYRLRITCNENGKGNFFIESVNYPVNDGDTIDIICHFADTYGWADVFKDYSPYYKDTSGEMHFINPTGWHYHDTTKYNGNSEEYCVKFTIKYTVDSSKTTQSYKIYNERDSYFGEIIITTEPA